MQYAINKQKEKIEAQPNIEAYCPGCGELVIAKCGQINIHHFAHKNNTDCDPWYEPESKWHRDWKEFFLKENREVIIGKHRADIKTSNGIVVELQNSSISSSEIEEREKFYVNMIWIVNGSDFFKNISFKQHDNYITFRWKHPRKCWAGVRCPVYIDLEDYHSGLLFQIKKTHTGLPCRGWGYFKGKDILLKQLGIK